MGYSILSSALSILILMQIQRYFGNAVDFPLPDRFKSGESIFTTTRALSNEYNPIDLGRGLPDYTPPKEITYALVNAVTSEDYSLSQYSPDVGHPRLLKIVSKLHSKLLNRTLTPENNVIITAGATGALFLTLLSHTFVGDEWILFEPFFEPYTKIVKAANGVPRVIKLKPKSDEIYNTTSSNWSFDREELSKLFNNKTKGIIINSPHNPTGKVFTLDELTFIANLAKKWKTLVVCDEVYQFSIFDNQKHIRVASLPGMFEQTITIGSAGKIFGVTGYRIGWAYGDSKLIDNLKSIQGFVIVCAPTPIQEAVAIALEEELRNFGKPYSFIERLRKETEASRNYLYRILNDVGMAPILPEGGYFMIANWTTMRSRIELDAKENECEDQQFTKWIIKNVRVLGMPVSTFFEGVEECYGKDLIRFTIIKALRTYENAEKLFSKWRQKSTKQIK